MERRQPPPRASDARDRGRRPPPPAASAGRETPGRPRSGRRRSAGTATTSPGCEGAELEVGRGIVVDLPRPRSSKARAQLPKEPIPATTRDDKDAGPGRAEAERIIAALDSARAEAEEARETLTRVRAERDELRAARRREAERRPPGARGGGRGLAGARRRRPTGCAPRWRSSGPARPRPTSSARGRRRPTPSGPSGRSSCGGRRMRTSSAPSRRGCDRSTRTSWTSGTRCARRPRSSVPRREADGYAIS